MNAREKNSKKHPYFNEIKILLKPKKTYFVKKNKKPNTYYQQTRARTENRAQKSTIDCRLVFKLKMYQIYKYDYECKKKQKKLLFS